MGGQVMKCILSIDGGGIRGIIPALVLAEIEKATGKRSCELFDLIAGTSTGGILALGLSLADSKGEARYSASDLAKLYEENGQKIFPRSLWQTVVSVGGITDEKYPHKGLEEVLLEYFGNEPMGGALTHVVVTSYDIQNRTPHFFKSWRKEWKTVEMRFVARATSAAPTYFEPALVTVEGSPRALIDGGVFINNPGMSAYVEAKVLFPGEDILVVSLGTGELTRPIPHKEAINWGKVGWLRPLLDCMFDGSSDAVDYQLEKMLGDDKYFRMQSRLEKALDDMDNVTKGNIENLKRVAETLLVTHKKDLKRLCDILRSCKE